MIIHLDFDFFEFLSDQRAAPEEDKQMNFF